MKKEKRRTYRCGQRTVRLADCGSQSQAVFARRRRKSKLKLLDIREEKKAERKERRRFASRRPRREFMKTHLLPF
ncbi:hypothetical protein TNCV_1512921 [Trichonephila clavipes]|nr:hypothetical protein TNCV_1512921 [Trichonephila clavipes]